MNKRRIVIASIAGAGALAVAWYGYGPTAGAQQTPQHEADDGTEAEAGEVDRPITGPDLERASEAALDHVGEGRVTETEVEDEESYYEIEITRDDGSQVDVQLDEGFAVVSTEQESTADD